MELLVLTVGLVFGKVWVFSRFCFFSSLELKFWVLFWRENGWFCLRERRCERVKEIGIKILSWGFGNMGLFLIVFFRKFMLKQKINMIL